MTYIPPPPDELLDPHAGRQLERRRKRRNLSVIVVLLGLVLASAAALIWMLHAAHERSGSGDYGGLDEVFERRADDGGGIRPTGQPQEGAR